MHSIIHTTLILTAILALVACNEAKNETAAAPTTPSESANGNEAANTGTPAEKPAEEAKKETAEEAKPAAKAEVVTAAAPAKAGCEYGKAVEAAEAAATSNAPAESPGCGALPTAKPLAATGKTHYGNAFVKTEAIAVDTLIADSKKYTNNQLLVTGRINKVCKKKGCWFVLQGSGDGSDFIRVTMKHSFFVPTDCEGKAVTVEGTFRSVPLPEAARKHLAEDGGEDPSKVKGSAVELTMVATGVSIES